MKVGIIIQARLGSTRLPNKVLKPLSFDSKITVIDQIIDRALKVENSGIVILATSNEKKDDALVSYLRKYSNIEIFRGSENNVLSRYYYAAKKYKIEQIVRLTGDNPCIDSEIISDTVKKHINAQVDYSYTKGYPLGMNVEVMKYEALEIAFNQGISDSAREHVTYYIREHPEQFNLNYIQSGLPEEVEHLRLTLDTPPDYTMIRILYDYLQSNSFGLKDILSVLKKYPYIFSVNSEIIQKKVYKTKKEELIAACDFLRKQEMLTAANILNKSIDKIQKEAH